MNPASLEVLLGSPKKESLQLRLPGPCLGPPSMSPCPRGTETMPLPSLSGHHLRLGSSGRLRRAQQVRVPDCALSPGGSVRPRLGERGRLPGRPPSAPWFSWEPEDLEARQKRCQFHLDSWDFHPKMERPERSCQGPSTSPWPPGTQDAAALGSPQRGRCPGPVSKHLPDGHTLLCPRLWEGRFGACRASATAEPDREPSWGQGCPHPGQKHFTRPQTPLLTPCCGHSCCLQVHSLESNSAPHPPSPPNSSQVSPSSGLHAVPSPAPQRRREESSQQGLGALAPSSGSLVRASSRGLRAAAGEKG